MKEAEIRKKRKLERTGKREETETGNQMRDTGKREGIRGGDREDGSDRTEDSGSIAAGS